MIGWRRLLLGAAVAALMGAAPPAGSLVYEFKANGGSGADASSYSPLAAGVALGSAAGNRCVFVTLHWRSTSGTPSISSVSVGGVSLAAVVTQVETTSNRTGVALWAGIVSSGTTGDLAVTFSSTVVRCMYTLGVSYGASATAFASSGFLDSPLGAETNPNIAGAINVPAGGLVIGAATANYLTSFTSFGWTGLDTEHVDTQATETNPYSLATQDEMSAETARAVSVTITGVDIVNRPMILASFAPA